MDAPLKNSSALFDVYLRLRPNPAATQCFLEVDGAPSGDSTHITIKPPENDYRKRAVEKFAFTKVFSEDASQLDILNGTSVLPLIEGVLGANGRGRDGLVATLGVTGSGKSHTILGSKTHRGLTQLSLDILYQSIGPNLAHPAISFSGLAAVDVADSNLVPASNFLETIYGDGDSRATSRAPTPMLVSQRPITILPTQTSSSLLYRALQHVNDTQHRSAPDAEVTQSPKTIRCIRRFARVTRSVAKTTTFLQETSNYTIYSSTPSAPRKHIPCVSALPQLPSVEDTRVPVDEDAEYAILLSMYEVYNDRIFDLLTGAATLSKTPAKDARRRPLLFKSTEYSPDRKVVAGLKKIVCGSLEQALLVLETGLTERRVAGTGSNAASSRSHGFFCVEVKKRRRSRPEVWSGSTFTIVDLAGSERARTAKTHGSTLAEAGKINESLMYLGQCMQMQSTANNSSTNGESHLVPFRQCKLTELLFSNYFPNTSSSLAAHPHPRQNQQKSIMIVTADPRGDFNATSQILRYSALAREVTVPRIPSVTSTIINGSSAMVSRTPSGTDSRPNTATSGSAPSFLLNRADDQEVARLTGEVAVLQYRLEEETRRRCEAEDGWARAEQRTEQLELDVREDCWNEFESRMRSERTKWLTAWEEERELVEGHTDRKLDLFARGVKIYEDPDEDAGVVHGARDISGNAEAVIDAMERENELLRAKLEDSEREKMSMRTPSRKMKVLKTKKWDLPEDTENFDPLD